VIVPEPEPRPEPAVETTPTNRPPGLRLAIVNARRFLGTTAPQLEVEKWITPPSATPGKFVLVDFWSTSCDQSSIPKLNTMQEKFKDRLVIIGLSDEPESAVRLLTKPRLNFAVAIDTKMRTKREVQVTIIPHAILMDPQGIVRFEGNPQALTETVLEQLLKTYAE